VEESPEIGAFFRAVLKAPSGNGRRQRRHPLWSVCATGSTGLPARPDYVTPLPPVPCPHFGVEQERDGNAATSSDGARGVSAAHPTGSPVEAPAPQYKVTSVTNCCDRCCGDSLRRIEPSSQGSNGPSPPPAHLGAPVRRERLPRQHASVGRPTSSEEGSPERRLRPPLSSSLAAVSSEMTETRARSRPGRAPRASEHFGAREHAGPRPRVGSKVRARR